jgi:hypothetical protein
MNNNPNLPGQIQSVQPGLAPAGLLGCAIVELIARRGAAEMIAMERKRAGKQVEAVGWECRAAGIAEAIAVCQMFKDAAQPNGISVEVSRSNSCLIFTI